MEKSKKTVPNDFLTKIHQEAKVVSNILNIIDKIDKEGFLENLKNALNSIINNEIIFTVNELRKLHKSNPKLDIKSQVTNNTYVFKENLKNISNFVSKLRIRKYLERKN
jgi:hypothetical protein